MLIYISTNQLVFTLQNKALTHNDLTYQFVGRRRELGTTMTEGLTVLIILSSICLIQTEEVPRHITLTELELGANVTFSCSFPKEIKFLHWYKQSLGKVSQTIASGVYAKLEKTEPFRNQRFQVQKANGTWSLTISFVDKEDEALYFCQSGTEYLQTFIDGFYLAVKDDGQQTAVYVDQSPDRAAVWEGDSVTLHCSLLSEKNQSPVKCPGSNSVHWFRAGSGKSQPSFIYRNNNSTDDDFGRKCVYSFSRTLQDSSDAGTYYCAVVTCGDILFGKGTQVDTRAKPGLLICVLGGLLVCCVIVIVFLLFYINRERAGIRVSPCLRNDVLTEDRSSYLDKDEYALSYTALSFSRKNITHSNKRRDHAECVYSGVREKVQSHTQLSLQAEQCL
ncbi:uncharacterized protein ACNS7B_012166 isoform 1-T1 [Menidia menidia]